MSAVVLVAAVGGVDPDDGTVSTVANAVDVTSGNVTGSLGAADSSIGAAVVVVDDGASVDDDVATGSLVPGTVVVVDVDEVDDAWIGAVSSVGTAPGSPASSPPEHADASTTTAASATAARGRREARGERRVISAAFQRGRPSIVGTGRRDGPAAVGRTGEVLRSSR
jgi:hypothetical protein